MNILYITNHLDIGGITSYCLTLASSLKSRGDKIFIASSGGEVLPKFIEEKVTFIPVPLRTKQEVSPGIFISVFKLARLVKKYNIDIVHSNSRTTQVVGCLLAKLTGAKHIFTCHGFFKNRFFRRIFPCWGKMNIAISEQVKEHLVEGFKLEAQKIKVIHNGIDVEKFKTQNLKLKGGYKKALGLNEAPVIGIIARLSDVKGHIYLIESFKEVLKAYPSAQLLICGDGKMKEELVGLVEIFGIKQSVYFIASAIDTKDILSAIDIFVMPSLQEGLGLSLMEAMACGLAVIGSNIGGIKTLVKDGVTGLLVEPADVNGLHNVLLRLLGNHELSTHLGSNASRFIADNFSQSKMAKETEELYKSCL